MGEADARLFFLCPIPTFVMTWKSVSTEKNPWGFLLGLRFSEAGGERIQ